MIKAIDEMLKLWAEEMHAPGSNGGGYAGGNLIAMLIASKGEVVRGHRGSRVILDRVAEVDRLVNRLPEELKNVVVEHYLNRDSFPSRSTATAVAAATPSICACMWRTRVSRTACCGGWPEFLDRIPCPPWNFPTGLRAGFFMPVAHGGGEPHAQQRTLHGRGGVGLAEPSFSSVDAGLFHIGSGYALARMPGEGSQGGISPSYRGASPPIAVDCREGIAGLGIGR